ncbi:Terpene synthase family, metal binding domain [Micromonospora rhizosphaerae]|uniref:Terpene synthase n=1 Tax=Micromonospora rhizosphaerae TaxID=568872 RepID=A0A1C6RIL0_9ACTN|nr:terpene synthase [Micromonospora rhizosphaerae]SCL17011.1 Terpene synthase family, metal binding domain [Micromonospora rhizosphaerae]
MTEAVLRSLRSDCPIPPRLSPYADPVQEWLVDRLFQLGLPLDPAALDRLARAGFARYAGRLYADATEPDLRALAALFTWFFLVDDACDGPGRLTPPQIRALRDGALALLRAGPRVRHPGFSGPLRRLLVQAWREPRRRMPARWRLRFADAVGHHLDGVWREAVARAAGRAPAVDEYVELRRATSAAYVSYPLIEFATGRPLPDPVYHHPALRRIADLGNDLLSWFNDLASLERDRATAGGHNLVLAVAAERGVPVRTAVELVAERWRAAMGRFVALRAAVPSFGPALDEAVTAHLDGIADAVRGTVDWTLESPRYPVGEQGPLVDASAGAGAPS